MDKSAKISFEVLNNYKKLGRNKDTWGKIFEVAGEKTQFQVKYFSQIDTYVVFINQNKLQQGIWENTICLGKLISIEDLETLYTSVTRGEHL